MGSALGRTDVNTQRINSYLEDAQHEEGSVVKLLLLGPGSTGKSTLFKSLQMVHSGGTLSTTTKKSSIRLIRLNIVTGIYTLMAQCNIVYKRDPIKYKDCQLIPDDNIKETITFIKNNLSLDFFRDSPWNDATLTKLGNSINTIWNLPCIQATYANRSNNFAISDNLEHFFNEITIDSIFDSNYLPSEEDCLKNRSKTSG